MNNKILLIAVIEYLAYDNAPLAVDPLRNTNDRCIGRHFPV